MLILPFASNPPQCFYPISIYGGARSPCGFDNFAPEIRTGATLREAPVRKYAETNKSRFLRFSRLRHSFAFSAERGLSEALVRNAG
jgi:hypothetical protein